MELASARWTGWKLGETSGSDPCSNGLPLDVLIVEAGKVDDPIESLHGPRMRAWESDDEVLDSILADDEGDFLESASEEKVDDVGLLADRRAVEADLRAPLSTDWIEEEGNEVSARFEKKKRRRGTSEARVGDSLEGHR